MKVSDARSAIDEEIVLLFRPFKKEKDIEWKLMEL